MGYTFQNYPTEPCEAVNIAAEINFKEILLMKLICEKKQCCTTLKSFAVL